jgi:hypothetical protein
MGKYAGVVEKLPKLPPEDLKYQDEVNATKEIIDARTAAALAQGYRDVRAALDELGERERELNLLLEAHKQLLEDAYESEGVDALKLADDGSTIATQPEPNAKIEDPVAFRRWCIDNGLGSALTLPWTTANAMVKELLLAGKPLPPGVKAYVRTKVVWR